MSQAVPRACIEFLSHIRSAAASANHDASAEPEQRALNSYHRVYEEWRTSGALDSEGNWHRGDLAGRALAAFANFIETLDPDTKELFEPALIEAWKYHVFPYEMKAQLHRPQPRHVRAMVEDNGVRVWVGTSQYLIQDLDGDP
jgi:hypothetical protein